jgi:hypothetical protein
MTDTAYVTVQYSIYSDAGYTTLSTVYSYMTEEMFLKNILDSDIETNYSLKDTLRLILSSTAGKLSGASSTSISIRDVNDTKNRIVATVDSSGNRTSLTYDVS